MTRGDRPRLQLKPMFFKTPADFRKWLDANHDKETELWVGYHKKSTGKPSITWPESVDQALCYGWIDGIRKSVDEDSYTIRFTPRTKRSTWSAVNTKRANELIRAGLMQPTGLRAFEARTASVSGDPAELPDPYATILKKNKAAWKFFQAQPPSYKRVVSWWIVTAKKEETRLKRLNQLIQSARQGRRL